MLIDAYTVQIGFNEIFLKTRSVYWSATGQSLLCYSFLLALSEIGLE